MIESKSLMSIEIRRGAGNNALQAGIFHGLRHAGEAVHRLLLLAVANWMEARRNESFRIIENTVRAGRSVEKGLLEG